MNVRECVWTKRERESERGRERGKKTGKRKN